MKVRRLLNFVILFILVIGLNGCFLGDKDYKEALTIYNSDAPDRYERAYTKLEYIKSFKEFLFLDLPNNGEWEKARELMNKIEEEYNTLKVNELKERYRGHKVVFVEESRKDKDKLCLSNIDGSEKVVLLEDEVYVDKRYLKGLYTPRWSPDGSKIAFSSISEIVIMNSDGTDIRVITDDRDSYDEPKEPNWSSDGKKLLFVNKYDELWVHDLESGENVKREDNRSTTAVWLKDSYDILQFRTHKLFLIRGGDEGSEELSLTLPDDSPKYRKGLSAVFSGLYTRNAVLSNAGDRVAVHNETLKIIDVVNNRLIEHSVAALPSFNWAPDDRYLVIKSDKHVALVPTFDDISEWKTDILLFPGDDGSISPVPIERR